jgi:uncharacterized protein DUF4242
MLGVGSLADRSRVSPDSVRGCTPYGRRMADTYLVECYWPGVDPHDVAEALDRAASEEQVQCLDSILVPEDEIVLCLFVGPSADAVRDASRRSGLPSERVTRSIRMTMPPGRARR